MRLTKYNPETGQYEYVEKAKTLDEYRAQRKAAIQKLGEFEDRAEGEWITPKSRDADDWKECSRCGYYFDVSVGHKPTSFCPECGAKMKGADDEPR